jgi:hypothetical protein
VYSREHDYAGTLDVVGEVDGQLAVVDWKTSKAVYDEMRLQAAAYAQAWAEMYDLRVPDRWVIRLDKETGEFEPIRFPRETFRRDLHGFLAAKAVHLTLEAMRTPKLPRTTIAASNPEPASTAATATAKIRPTNAQMRTRALAHERSISYLKSGAAIVLGGATFDVKDQLPTIGGRRTKQGSNWIWQIPLGSLDSLSALCNARRIRLIPTA